MKIYFVKAGDTLSAIAEKHGVTVEQMLAANPIIADPDDLKVAMKLVIPDKKTDLPAKALPADVANAESQKDVPEKALPAKEHAPKDHTPMEHPPMHMPQMEQQPMEQPPMAQQPMAQPPMKLPQMAYPKVDHCPKEHSAIPVMPAFPGATGMVAPGPAMPVQEKHSPCQSCKSAGPVPMPQPLPYALQQKQHMPIGKGGHPAAMTPPWAHGTGGAASSGPWQPGQHGGAGGFLHAQPTFPPVMGGMPAGSWPGSPAVQHPFAAMPQQAYPVQGHGFPHAYGQGQPFFGTTWDSGPWSGGQPGSGNGFHSPYNTPFSVNPYLLPADQPAYPVFATPTGQPQGPGPSPWQPYRLQTAAAPAFVPPHATPAVDEAVGDVEDDEEEKATPTRSSTSSGRKKTVNKKRKPSGETALKDKILRMQRNHRRYW